MTQVLRQARGLRSKLGLALACAAVALLATAFFFLLHHLGNQIPYDLAVQRFQAELESGRPDEGHAKGYKSKYEYCEISGAVIAGARGDRPAAEPFRDAVVLKQLEAKPPAGGRQRCRALRAVVNGGTPAIGVLKTRYWWGGKALYAIALRWLSVYQIRELTKVATRVAYLLLAASLAALAPKMLLLAAPLLIFGAFFSGIDYWADIANGPPYLWTLLFAAALALLTRIERGAQKAGTRSPTVPVACFLAGTVSSFLYQGDGHAFLAVVWIGLVVWFGCGAPDVAERTRRAVSCIVLYGAGIVACHALGQAVKAMFVGSFVASNFWSGFVNAAKATWLRGDDWMWMWMATDAMSVPAYLNSFYAMVWPSWLPANFVPTFVALFALAASLGFAVFEARRRRPDLLWGVLWIVGLIAVSSMTFLIREHFHHRTARFAFVPLALCLSCLVLSVRTMDWKSLAKTWELPILLVVAGCVAWYVARFELSATAKSIDSVKHLQPVVNAVFDVYLDGNRLVYVKEKCGDEDGDARFFLHLHPVDVADLPVHRRPHGFDNYDFSVSGIGRRDAGRCTAERTLPDYGMVAIHTGQFLPEKGQLWNERINLGAAYLIESVKDMRPLVRSVFDVYLDGNRLVYVKEECGGGDDDALFFLHLHPVDVADLPDPRQPHGFDNLDFDLRSVGQRDAGRCAAVRILPNYGMVAIHTGQYLPDTGHVWSERISLE